MKYTNEIFDFIKETLQIGGAYVVDEEGFIRDSEGELITLNINKKPKPVMVYNANMKVGEHCILNPMVDNIASTVERNWYFNTLSRICGGLMHTLMDAVIRRVVAEMDDEGDGNFTTIEAFSSVTKNIDKKLLVECDKLHSTNLFKIFYSATKHIAQAQTDLDDISYMEELASVRKKSWGVFQALMEVLMDTTLEELGSKFSYKSKHIGFGKLDAMLNLYVMVLQQIQPFVSALLPDTYHYDLSRIVSHIENLKAYNKDCAWFAGGTAVKKIEDEPEEVAPWQQQPTQQSWQQPQLNIQQPMMQQPQPGQMIAMPITGMVQPKPFKEQPTSYYPGYGQPMGVQQAPQQQFMYPNQGMMYPNQNMMYGQQPNMQVPMMQQPMMYGQMQQQMMNPNMMVQQHRPINTQSMLNQPQVSSGPKYNKSSSGVSYNF